MVNIYNYLKNVWKKVSLDLHQNSFAYLVLLVLLTLPLPYIFSSIAAIILVVYGIIFYPKGTFQNSKSLWIPIVLYFGIAMSYFWSITPSLTFSALSKQIPLFLFPLVFFWHRLENENALQKVKNGYVFGYTLYALFWLSKAVIRFGITGSTHVFFYHELVTNDLNAIHVSLYLALGFFMVLEKKKRTLWDYFSMGILALCIVLLSSKNIIVLFFILALFRTYYLFRNQLSKRLKWTFFIALLSIGVIFSGKVKERFYLEIASNTEAVSINQDIGKPTEKVFNVSIKDAWNRPVFNKNDFFPGTALRVYQLRIFKEMMQEDGKWFTGYGANATDLKIKQKRIAYQLYEGYDVFNFHNQYIQLFAEIGVFGFLLCIVMVLVNLKIAIKRKDFVHFSFAILIISLFLTESFLARQRGVLFFTLFYCIYNSLIDKEIKSNV